MARQRQPYLNKIHSRKQMNIDLKILSFEKIIQTQSQSLKKIFNNSNQKPKSKLDARQQQPPSKKNCGRNNNVSIQLDLRKQNNPKMKCSNFDQRILNLTQNKPIQYLQSEEYEKYLKDIVKNRDSKAQSYLILKKQRSKLLEKSICVKEIQDKIAKQRKPSYSYLYPDLQLSCQPYLQNSSIKIQNQSKILDQLSISPKAKVDKKNQQSKYINSKQSVYFNLKKNKKYKLIGQNQISIDNPLQSIEYTHEQSYFLKAKDKYYKHNLTYLQENRKDQSKLSNLSYARTAKQNTNMIPSNKTYTKVSKPSLENIQFKLQHPLVTLKDHNFNRSASTTNLDEERLINRSKSNKRIKISVVTISGKKTS